MKGAHWITLAIIGMGTAIAAPADSRERDATKPRPKPPGEPANRGFLDFFKRADADGDGRVSKAEFMDLERLAKLTDEQSEQIFGRLDKDGDGFVTSKELKVTDRGPGGHGNFPNLGELDTNGDRSVSYEEFLEGRFVQRMPEDRRRTFFDRLDQNGDGRLSAEDRRRGGMERGPGPRPDRRGDFKPEFKGRFEDVDQNKDGSIDFDEFRSIPGIKDRGEDFQEDRFEALDKNGDLKLERNEFKQGPPSPPEGPGRKPFNGPPKRDSKLPDA